MKYDEDAELAKYAWQHCQHLLSDFELRVERAIYARSKASSAEHLGDPRMALMLNEKWGLVHDPKVNAALAEGAEAFHRRVLRRVLAAPSIRKRINRCPACHRVVRTPQAKSVFGAVTIGTEDLSWGRGKRRNPLSASGTTLASWVPDLLPAALHLDSRFQEKYKPPQRCSPRVRNEVAAPSPVARAASWLCHG